MKDRNDALESDLPAGLGAPAARALAAAGIRNLEQLTHFRETEIKKLHGVGPNAMNKLSAAMAEKGLSYADTEKPNAGSTR